uniref:Spectrin repeat containing nuclear envelope family member 4 n=1 Tax=Sciurus vulgaris TaxID=55149 RepID=A0A8D2JK82_SCIVU
MVLSPPRLPSEPLNHPPGAPREPDVAGCTICPVSGEETIRKEQAQDSLDPPGHVQGGLRGTEPPRTSTPSFQEDSAGNKHHEVFEKASMLDQDLEVEGDLDGPGPDGVWGPWAPSNLPTPAELEWDPAGDVGGLGPSKQKTSQTPGAPCELCGHRGPQGRGQNLEKSHTPLSSQDMLTLGLSHQKHLVDHLRRSLLRKPQDKKRQTSPILQDVMLEVDPGASAPTSRWPLTVLFILFLFLLLMSVTLFLPMSGSPCCFRARRAQMPYLMLSYVNGLPPI